MAKTDRPERAKLLGGISKPDCKRSTTSDDSPRQANPNEENIDSSWEKLLEIGDGSTCAQSKGETELPGHEKLRGNTNDPRVTKSATDKEDRKPNRATPNASRALPMQARHHNDNNKPT